MKTGKGTILLYLLIMGLFVSSAFWGSHAVTTVSQSTPIRRDYCFIIDAGHGGVDGGATSCTGILESNLNLQIALRLNDLLRFLGYETKMIRTEDISVYTEGETIAQKKVSDLKERVRICNETEGAILLSIHQNNFSDNRYSGAQVFYPHSESSESFAKNLQGELIRTLNPGSKRNAKQAKGIYLLEHITCPGVLIECGFLSSPEEEAKLRSEAYQKKVCSVIAACAVRFTLDAQTND